MSGRFLSEVTRSDGSSIAIVIDSPETTAAERELGLAIVAQAVADLAAECNIHPDTAATALAIEVTERIADAAAYEREAARPDLWADSGTHLLAGVAS